MGKELLCVLGCGKLVRVFQQAIHQDKAARYASVAKRLSTNPQPIIFLQRLLQFFITVLLSSRLLPHRQLRKLKLISLLPNRQLKNKKPHLLSVAFLYLISSFQKSFKFISKFCLFFNLLNVFIFIFLNISISYKIV